MCDISDQNLAASLSSFTISSVDTTNSDAASCRADTVGCRCAAAAVDILNSQTEVDITADKTAGKASVVAASENSAEDVVASCSRTDRVTTLSLSYVSDEGYKDSEAISCVLCLLHGLSHCSYHEPSLLVLAEHAAYDATVDLFVYIWHKLQTCQQQDDKIQARIFFAIFCLVREMILVFRYLIVTMACFCRNFCQFNTTVLYEAFMNDFYVPRCTAFT